MGRVQSLDRRNSGFSANCWKPCQSNLFTLHELTFPAVETLWSKRLSLRNKTRLRELKVCFARDHFRPDFGGMAGTCGALTTVDGGMRLVMEVTGAGFEVEPL